MVKVRIVTSLLVIYLFGATDGHQLLKLPFLVSHFVKHKRENFNITIAAFLKMHYVDPQPMDADYAQDMQLPFKTISNIPCRTIPTIVSMPPDIGFHAPGADIEKQPLTNVNIDFSWSVKNIFHPPRGVVAHNLLLNQCLVFNWRLIEIV
jgi:hypothetical protein